jgi:hypothetical protein
LGKLVSPKICVGQFNHQNYLGTRCKPNSLSPATRRTWRTSTTLAAGGGGGGAFPCVDREVNVIFGGHGSQESKRRQKLNDRQILVAATGPPAPYRWSKHSITFTRAD